MLGVEPGSAVCEARALAAALSPNPVIDDLANTSLFLLFSCTIHKLILFLFPYHHFHSALQYLQPTNNVCTCYFFLFLDTKLKIKPNLNSSPVVDLDCSLNLLYEIFPRCASGFGWFFICQGGYFSEWKQIRPRGSSLTLMSLCLCVPMPMYVVLNSKQLFCASPDVKIWWDAERGHF